MARRTIKVTLEVDVETDLMGVDNIVNNLSFAANELTENVEVKHVEVVNF